jgi:cysteinyl-tRNA synthetase
MLKLYNTLNKQIEEIKKPEGRRINMYSCGPTIYNYAHIGNLRSFIIADLLYRTLKYGGYQPRWVMNLTDIDDKTIKGTIEKFGKDAGVKELFDFTEIYREAFVNDLREVNVMVDEIEFIRVTEKMSEIQEFIIELISKGYAYKAEDGSTYFSIEKYQKDFGDYGQLVGEKFLEGKKVGARVAVDEYEKDNLSDFALWKAHNAETDGNIFWDHPELSKGRPGWHIECSVINKVAFGGEPTDIHTGGVDLIFPHHTNEIAQSQALLGKGNFVHHWLHSEHLLVDGQRMGKRFKNFYTIKDLEGKGFSGQDLRYLFFGAQYRGQQNFTFDALAAAKAGLERSENNNSESFDVKPVAEAMNKDLSVPDAIANIFSQKASLGQAEDLFGISSEVVNNDPLPEKVEQLLAERQAARDMKDFQKSDELRLKIGALGYEVKDTSDGQEVKKK